MRISYNALAERELNDTIRYYEHEQLGLGAAFLSEVRRTAVAIAEFPDAGSIVGGAVRRRLCHRFPYALLDSLREDEIRILAVMNQKRRPGYWVGRS